MRPLILFLILAGLAGLGSLWLGADSALPPAPEGRAVPTSIGPPGVAHREANPRGERVAVQGRSQGPSLAEESLLTGRLLQGGVPLAGAAVLVCKGPTTRIEVLQRATTDEDGRFTVQRDRADSWLTADGATIPRHWKASWRIEGSTILDLDVPLASVLQGTVRTAQGAGVVGAEVRLFADSYGSFKLPDAPDVMVHTDADGRFRFERVSAKEERLSCRADGYAYKSRHRVAITPGETASTQVVLEVGSTLQGVVMDHRGQPLVAATVKRSYGDAVLTDELGRFQLSHFVASENLNIRAAGHLNRRVEGIKIGSVLRVQLERSVTMRGTVVGSQGRPGTVYIEPATWSADASRTPCYDLTNETLDVVRDGQFELSGFSMSDFEVTVSVPGVGKVGPVRVELRDDVHLTFELVPFRQVLVSVRNDLGQIVPTAKLIRDRGIDSYPTLYEPSAPDLKKRILGSYKRDKPQPVPGGELPVYVSPGEGLAFAVEADGHLTEARAIKPDGLMGRMDVVLTRAATLRGTVQGLEQTKHACRHSISVFATDSAKAVATARVGENGAFVLRKLAPGDYRAAAGRSNTASVGERSLGLPLIDGGADPGVAVPFVAKAGEEVVLELALPKLGRMTGRVLLHGKPVPNAAIVAVRPSRAEARQRKRRARSMRMRVSWDEEYQLAWVCGQRTRDDGSFTFLYRDAGPAEVRLRHEGAQLTSNAMVVDLPPPGDEFVRNFDMPSGEIRGRYPVESLTKRERRFFEVAMFPLDRSLADPYYAPHHGSSISMDCPRVQKSKDGGFVFAYLRSGTWLLRAHSYRERRETVLWQRVISVHNDVVDLGELPAIATAVASIAWRWQSDFGGSVSGVWLRKARADGAPAVWAGTLRSHKTAPKGGLAKGPMLPGHYEVVPFGRWTSQEEIYRLRSFGVSGEPLAKPQRVHVRADGSVEPAEVLFVVSPPEEGK